MRIEFRDEILDDTQVRSPRNWSIPDRKREINEFTLKINNKCLSIVCVIQKILSEIKVTYIGPSEIVFRGGSQI